MAEQLMLGIAGSDVAAVHRSLTIVGIAIPTDELREDRFGPGTEAAIRRLQAEKGLPIPPELMEAPRQGNAGLRGGLVLVALGIALSVFFAGWGPGWSIGLIPGLMGIALLVAWKIETKPKG